MNLYERLNDLRDEYRAETIMTMTVTAPPVVTQINQDGTVTFVEEPAARIGLTLSADMVRLLGHPEGYGMRFAVRRALHSFEGYCSRKHKAWPDHQGYPLCAQMAWEVLHGSSVTWQAEFRGIGLPRAERMLERAVEYIDSQRERWEARSVA